MWYAVSGQRPWQHILSSPLRRCSEFAQALSEEMGIPLDFDWRLQEVGFGVWEGKSGDELRAQDPDILQRFYQDPVLHRPADAEPLADFRGRVEEALSEAIVAHAGKHLLIVAHAGVIRAMLAYALSVPHGSLYRMSISNASLTRLQLTGERPLSALFMGKSRL